MIINDSLKATPRDYVLIGIKSKEVMGVTSYDKALSDIFDPKKPRQSEKHTLITGIGPRLTDMNYPKVS